jgi:NAD(P)H-hydrate epimerase
MNLGLPALPARDARGHKGTFGTVAVVGGCCAGATRMIGAPALSARAALRSGAGLVKVLAPGPVINEVIAMTPSATGIALATDARGRIVASDGVAALDGLIDGCGAVAVGPGLGRAPESGDGPAALALRAVQQETTPVVIDADGIVALAGIAELHRDFRAPAVLTPHPGEFRTIAGALRITADPTDPTQRQAAAEALAQRVGCVVVLKGAGTVVSDGQRTWVCGRGHACLATAGTGDVLTGLIAGLAAQFVRVSPLPRTGGPIDLFDAARIGVEAHAIAGERWAASHQAAAGLVATELADLLPAVLEEMRG